MINLTFPREVGPPRIVVKNLREYLTFLNRYNGRKKAIYHSIYKFENLSFKDDSKPIYNSALVDCLFFDFDDKSCNAYEEVKRLHTLLLEQDLKHCIVMSGRGYHLYLFTKIQKLEYIKEAIRGGQMYFIDKLKLNVDKQVIGNPAQLARIPNTYNVKGKRFCIPLSKDQFDKGDLIIKENAKKQNFIKDNNIGTKLFDLSPFDKKDEMSDLVDYEEVNTSNDIPISDFPPCILKLLKKGNCSWKERYIIIIYLRERGYTQQETLQLLKDFLTEDKFIHCIREERQLQYLYTRRDLMFPKCKELMKDGYCMKMCKQYDEVIYKK
jgi:hypothetical protein